MDPERKSAEHFLDIIQRSRMGKFKLYIGMSAGVGKTYRMLLEAHSLLRNGIDVKVAYVETHGRQETEDMLLGLPIIPRRKIFYKGKALEELDVQAVLNLRPKVVIVDELAHSNIEGSKNEKRWQDVVELLEAGINVISAVNIQHIESLNEDVRKITAVEVRERVPDRVLLMADEIVNIDLGADELIDRLKAGKIYKAEKIQAALNNFFQRDHILQLRELALKEVAGHVVRKVDKEVTGILRHERFMVCISSNAKLAKSIIRKTARMAGFYSAEWYVLYVQARKESSDKIALDKQRMLINNFKLATELGGQVLQVKHNDITSAIADQVLRMEITTLCLGKPSLNRFAVFRRSFLLPALLRKLKEKETDIILLS